MTHEDELRQWAKGSPNQEAATELLLRAFAGRYARPEQPWVNTGVGYMSVWIDFAGMPDQILWLPDRERHVLLVAASLAENVPVVLGEVLVGLDKDNLALVLAAIAHAGTTEYHGVFGQDPPGAMGWVASASRACIRGPKRRQPTPKESRRSPALHRGRSGARGAIGQPQEMKDAHPVRGRV